MLMHTCLNGILPWLDTITTVIKAANLNEVLAPIDYLHSTCPGKNSTCTLPARTIRGPTEHTVQYTIPGT